jgi:hypothetical protein
MCHQSVGLVQNTIEGAGISTISMSLKPEVTERMNLPRAAYVRFPYGNALGMPGNSEQQREIMKAALRLVAELEEPGLIVKLPFRWQGRPISK